MNAMLRQISGLLGGENDLRVFCIVLKWCPSFFTEQEIIDRLDRADHPALEEAIRHASGLDIDDRDIFLQEVRGEDNVTIEAEQSSVLEYTRKSLNLFLSIIEHDYSDHYVHRGEDGLGLPGGNPIARMFNDIVRKYYRVLYPRENDNTIKNWSGPPTFGLERFEFMKMLPGYGKRYDQHQRPIESKTWHVDKLANKIVDGTLYLPMLKYRASWN